MSVPVAHPDEYRAAREAAAFFDSSDRELLRVTGPDRESFLQGMVTNDVKGLAVSASCYAALLTPKGAMVGDVRVFKRADDFVLDTGAGFGAKVKAFLNQYLISEDAEVHDAPELKWLGLWGPQAQRELSALPSEWVLGRAPSLFAEGIDVLVAAENVPRVPQMLGGVAMLSAATAEVIRVENGMPKYGVDMVETTIPLEANLERAIHYNKGCYIGQEVIARATYRGHMNRKLTGLLVGEAAPVSGSELRRDEKKVGWITSVVRSVRHGENLALGYVHRDSLSAGTELTMGDGGIARTISVEATRA
jgi:folate-binding protein YgfZ